MKKILAIDPGPEESAFVEFDGEIPFGFGLIENVNLLRYLTNYPHCNTGMVIERVACYGMPVGESIFETVYWTGRFCEVWKYDYKRIPRKDVKMHLCQSVRAKDSNVIQALVDRFSPYEKNKGKGTKKEPGFFYGFKKDIWQAFALAVTYWDSHNETT